MALVKGARYWLLAFGFAYAIWLIHDDSSQGPELLAGIVVAAIAATGTEVVRRQRVAPLTIRLRYLARAWRLPWSAARDSVTLSRLAVAQLFDRRPVRGRTVAMPFAHGGDEALENGRRALTQGLGSFSPGTIVVGVDPESDRVVAHQLGCEPTKANLDPLELG
jgi:multisubunit Na+/H+ antiporter MnhE subunit